MIKYILKREPSHVFNIHEGDILREHVLARRLGSMELMFLLLGHQICTSFAIVKFLITKPPATRTYAILPAYMIHDNDQNPYYDDTITKYMSRPHLLQFKILTYPNTSKSILSLPQDSQHQHLSDSFTMISAITS